MAYYRGPATESYNLKVNRMLPGKGGDGDKIRTAALGEDEGIGHVLPAADGTQGFSPAHYATGYATPEQNEATMRGKMGRTRLDRPGFKRGGRVKGTTVNVIVAPQNAPKIMPAPMGGPAGGLPPMPPPAGGPPMAGPAGPPMGGPPPMMRKHGGRVPDKDGKGPDKDGDCDDMPKRKRGGRVGYDAGAGSGEGRLEKKAKYGKNAKK